MKLIFVERRKEAGDAFTFLFRPKRKFSWQAGQYLFYTIPVNNPDNRGITRYFTISSAPSEKHIQITTRISEKPSTFKKSLMKLKAGNEIEASGPDGDFIVDDPKRNLVFIAGGIGITPFRSILTEFSHKERKLNVQLLYANRNEGIVFKDELESLKKNNPNLIINYFVSPVHIDFNIIKDLDLSSFFYISGPSTFVRSIRDILKELNVPKDRIKLDFFPGYEF